MASGQPDLNPLLAAIAQGMFPTDASFAASQSPQGKALQSTPPIDPTASGGMQGDPSLAQGPRFAGAGMTQTIKNVDRFGDAIMGFGGNVDPFGEVKWV